MRNIWASSLITFSYAFHSAGALSLAIIVYMVDR